MQWKYLRFHLCQSSELQIEKLNIFRDRLSTISLPAVLSSGSASADPSYMANYTVVAVPAVGATNLTVTGVGVLYTDSVSKGGV